MLILRQSERTYHVLSSGTYVLGTIYMSQHPSFIDLFMEMWISFCVAHYDFIGEFTISEDTATEYLRSISILHFCAHAEFRPPQR